MTSTPSYEEALAGIDDRIQGGIGPSLDRIAALAELLGDPQRHYPSVHITGTNGKTSVARMVTALFGALGIQAGTYTSPHLQDIRERIRVAGRPISREGFAQAYADVAPLAEIVDERRSPGDKRVTYFEIVTAMAYWWFSDHPIDVGVFEVGMGGTWDATNLVRGEVAVLNTVDVDHRELGATPAEIAQEKTGIIKPGSRVVSARQHDDVLAVIKSVAERQGSDVVVAGEHFGIADRRLAVGGQLVGIESPTRRHDEIILPLHGPHQAENAALALAAFDAFLGGLDDVSDELIREGFAAVEVPGRLEVVHRDPTVVLDGAHNPAGAVRAAEAVRESFAFRDIVLVLGCMADKEVDRILTAFRDVASHVVVTAAPSDRAMPPDQLGKIAQSVWAGTSVAIEESATIEQAIEKATGIVGESDAVLVTGSLYTVGAARDLYAPIDDAGDGDDEPGAGAGGA
jgi:dihydrofolate synthase / folylpolyglutamate synthase